MNDLPVRSTAPILTPTLMLLGAFVLLAIDSQSYGVKRAEAAPAGTAFAPTPAA